MDVTPYIGEGAEECKLTAHTLKTDRGVTWEVVDCFSFYVCKRLSEAFLPCGNLPLYGLRNITTTNVELQRRLLYSCANRLVGQLN